MFTGKFAVAIEVFASFQNHQPFRRWLVWALSTVVMLVGYYRKGLVASIVAMKVCAVLPAVFVVILYKYLKCIQYVHALTWHTRPLL